MHCYLFLLSSVGDPKRRVDGQLIIMTMCFDPFFEDEGVRQRGAETELILIAIVLVPVMNLQDSQGQ